MRFVGQGAEIDLSIEIKDFTKFSKDEIRTMFDDEYKRLYGRTSAESPVEFVTFKVRASLPKKPFTISKLSNKNRDLQTCIKGQRQAFSVIKKEYIPFTVYDRSKLFANALFEGPAIIEERESTIVIGEDAKARVDEFGFIWIQLAQSGGPDQPGLTSRGGANNE
jgi:N-methylhydantoinase A